MSLGYKIASLLVFGVLAFAWYASYHGWGLRSDADLLAKNQGRARSGSIHARRYYGGGPRYGK